MNLNTEIRKLSPANLYNLVQILEQDDSWKKLMAVIPKTLTLDNFECKITMHNLPKYNTDHFKLVDSAGYKQRRPCAEILIEEWGTSGRIRPRLGHLISLLKKIELFRAADFVAMDLLKMPEVDRPSTGPAAKVHIPKDEQLNNYIPRNVTVNYPSSILEGEAFSSRIFNEIMNQRVEHVIPEIRIVDVDQMYEQNEKKQNTKDIPNFSELLKHENSSSPINPNSDGNMEVSVSSSISNSAVSNSTDLTDLSNGNSEISNSALPDFSNILNSDNNSNISANINHDSNYAPAISDLLNSKILENGPSNLNDNQSKQLPAFSQILDSEVSQNLPAFSQMLDSENGQKVSNNGYYPGNKQISTNSPQNSHNIPAFSQIGLENSQILNSSSQNIPAFSQIGLENSQILNSNSQNIPAFSQIGLENSQILNSNSQNIPAFSQIGLENSQVSYSNTQNMTSSKYSPVFSQIMDNNSAVSQNIPAFSQIGLENSEFSYSNSQNMNINKYTPVFSQIMDKSSIINQNIPAFSQIGLESNPILNSNSQNMEESPENVSQNVPLPAFTEILTPSDEIPEKNPALDIPDRNLLQSSPAGSVHSNSSRSCASPLPNLLLNTILPHFTYQQLEICTQNFDESLLSMQESTNLNQAARFGRKLGSGAFGSVYLGIGLLDKPVAVKKLNLNGVVVVNVDDTITKQFRNEVELLCKYNHENLLSLLGYSCDGPTYCLIYEYICGGALKDRLQSSLKHPDLFRLLWTDRLYIALGTAKAVAYLHNAHSMPLIHRDIKSANILLDGTNKPKLCDFGLIKLTPNQNTITSTTVFGTSAYMAPEAFRGDVSVKLDTFSFGVVLLELLTSLPPLDEGRQGNDLITHVEEICEDDIKPLLDMHAGSWVLDGTHFGEKIYNIATQCLEEKRRRPVMNNVVSQLTELISKSVP